MKFMLLREVLRVDEFFNCVLKPADLIFLTSLTAASERMIPQLTSQYPRLSFPTLISTVTVISSWQASPFRNLSCYSANSTTMPLIVIFAHSGIHNFTGIVKKWLPIFTRMTTFARIFLVTAFTSQYDQNSFE